VTPIILIAIELFASGLFYAALFGAGVWLVGKLGKIRRRHQRMRRVMGGSIWWGRDLL